MAQFPSALACHLSRLSRRLLPMNWMAKSMMVVVPPKAAARVPVSNVSTDCVPPNGISIWVWPSMPPGMTNCPVASITRSAPCAHSSEYAEPRAQRPTMISPSTSTSAATGPDALTTVPPLISSFIGLFPSLLIVSSCSLGGGQAPVAIWPTITIERPRVADVGEYAHVKVTNNELILGARGVLPNFLTSGIHKVRGPVEIVVTEFFGPHSIDRSDEVLVCYRGGWLFKVPKMRRQPATGCRRIEHDSSARESEGPPTFGEVAVVADIDADGSNGGVKDRIAQIAGSKVKLLPEALDLRDVVLAVLA